MKKIVQILTVLTLLGGSAKVLAQTPCPAPTGISTTVMDSNAVVTWSGSANSYYVKYRPIGMTIWEDGTTTTTSKWLYDLCASTTYEVEVYGLCGCDTSDVAIDTFSMPCGTLRHYPYAEAFEAGGDSCWTSIGDGWDDGSGWELRNLASQAYSGSKYMYSPAITYGTSPASWLISPAIEVPSDANGFMLRWQGRQSEGGNSYRLRLSTGADSTGAFTTILSDFASESTVWTQHNVSLDSFAGQTVYIAFEHYSSNYGGGIMIDDVKLETLYYPSVAITGVRTIDVDSVAVLTAHLLSGSSSGLAYEWSCFRYDAVYGSTDSVEFHVSYPTSGYDTITLVGSNDYGTDTATFIIYARDLTPVTEFPYTTGFEEGDDLNWTSAGGLHDWYVGQDVASTGLYSIYVSHDGGQTSAYTVDDSYHDGTSYTFVYRGFHFTEPGDYVLNYDWEGHGGLGTTGIAMLTDDITLFEGDVRPSASRYTLLHEDLDDSWDETPWAHNTDTFAIADTGVYYIAFCWLVEGFNGYTHALAVDNISLDRIACSSVSQLTVDSVSSDYLSFSWTPTGSDSSWFVAFDNDSLVQVYDTFYIATGLSPATTHTISVSAMCAIGDTSAAVTISAMTSCVVINSLPFAENFNGYTIGTELPCWTKLGDGDVTVDDGRVGNGLLFDPDGEAEPFMIILPEFSANISGLQLTMYSRPRDQYSGSLDVGYVTNISSASSFHSTLHLQRSDFLNDSNEIEYVQHTATFTGAPAGSYIAIKQSPWGSHRWWVVDDIVVDTVGATGDICAAPTNLTVDYVSTTTAQLSWTAGDSEQQWVLELNGAALSVSANPYTLTGLSPSTSYEVRLRAICDTEHYSDWTDYVTVTTEDEELEGISDVAAQSFSLYPNPASKAVTLSTDQQAAVSIVDINGRVLVLKTLLPGSSVLDISTLVRGVYFVHFVSDNLTVTRKLIVE